jgi:2-(1,2-epoxy-1,2-dihydrophenyl)acetyl-CoA isomerase
MTITITKQDGIATVKLDRADKLNALTAEMYEGLADAFAELTFDDEVRAVILTGAGRAFCAGSDVGKMGSYDVITGRKRTSTHQRMIKNLHTCEKPVIAAIRGPVAGIGASLALACDLIIASERAEWRLPQVALGIRPADAGSTRLARFVGKGMAQKIADNMARLF